VKRERKGEVEGRGGERGGDVEVPRKWSASPGHALALGGPDRRTIELQKKKNEIAMNELFIIKTASILTEIAMNELFVIKRASISEHTH